jgi:type II secretory pathway component PulF
MASLSELQALNTEMASLARAGVPLELGLSHLASTLPGKLGGLAERMAQRMQQGRSLVQALEQEGRGVSPTYVAVVEAALEAQQLPQALDALVEYGSAVQDLRRRVMLALLYPALVAVFAYGLFCLFVVQVTPVILETLELAPESAQFPLRAIQFVRDTALLWIPLLPVLGVAVLWIVSRGLAALSSVRLDSGSVLNGAWFPGVTGLYADLDRSQTTGLLGLLLDHGVPLPRALQLTGAATRSPSLAGACARLAAGVEQGRSLKSLVENERQLPPLMVRLFRAGESEGRLSDALAQAATIYRRRAVRRAEWLRTILPPAMVALVGGGITLLYALTLFLPLKSLWMGF